MARYVYPLFSTLGAFGFRTGGPGLGNLLFPYARALLLAKDHDWELINPSWGTLKVGTILRWERDKRWYARIFKDKGIGGIKKTALLLTRPKIAEEEAADREVPHGSIVTTTGLKDFFKTIAHERSYVAGQIAKLLWEEDAAAIRANGPYKIGVHVRMGDFQAHQRIPLSWYVAIIGKIRAAAGKEVPVSLASDGSDEELAELLSLPGVKRLDMNAVADLFALSSAKLILASNSTFSAWAAFLGHVPIVWARRDPSLEGIFVDGTFDAVVDAAAELPSQLVNYITKSLA